MIRWPTGAFGQTEARDWEQPTSPVAGRPRAVGLGLCQCVSRADLKSEFVSAQRPGLRLRPLASSRPLRLAGHRGLEPAWAPCGTPLGRVPFWVVRRRLACFKFPNLKKNLRLPVTSAPGDTSISMPPPPRLRRLRVRTSLTSSLVLKGSPGGLLLSLIVAPAGPGHWH